MTATNIKTDFQKYLLSVRACEEAREWAGDRTAESAWKECERADWLLWWAAIMAGVDRKVLVGMACVFARSVLQYVKPGELRPLQAIEAAEAWCDGKATIQQVREARKAAAAYAAYAAASAAAAAYAAYAAASAAARYSERWREARAAKLRTMADLVRENIPFPGAK